MDRREELEQQLWEFVFDLLSPEEADAMRDRITSDPDAARLYAEVKLQTQIVAEALKMRHPVIPLPRPEDAEEEPAVEPPSDTPVKRPHTPTINRSANWVAAMAASVLLCYLGYAYYQPKSPVRPVAVQSVGESMANQAIVTTVLGANDWQAATTNTLTIHTRDLAGESRAAKVAVRLCAASGENEKEILAEGECLTDSSGLGHIRLAADVPTSNVLLEIEPDSDVGVQAVSQPFSVRAGDLSTHLTTDRTVYRPGDTVSFRSVTLSRYDLQVREGIAIEYQVLDPDGAVVAGSELTVDANQGVGSGSVNLPGDQRTGEHRLVASSATGEFPEVRRSFHVRHYDVPELKKQLDFVRDSFGPGDEVVADISVQRAEGEARSEPIHVVADVDGRRLLNLATATDDAGKYRVRFPLPKRMAEGRGELELIVGETPRERISEEIPIHTGAVLVEFYPESGDLVAGITNRVYFFAHDTLNQPVHIEGTVTDGQGDNVAEVATVQDGRGVFQLKPALGQVYQLKLSTPPDSTEQPALPEPSKTQFLTVNSGSGVFSAGSPIELDLHTTRSDCPVLVNAVCRGAVVGQAMVPAERFVGDEDGIGSCGVSLELADDASGVIRVTAYDSSEYQMIPVAERLVFRHPSQELQIGATGAMGPFRPGDHVNLDLAVTDERGAAQPAVLGVSIVNEATLSLVRDRSASLTTHFWLTGQIEDARGLEDANLYLDETSQADQWLDLLLGTQGWRRFASPPVTHLAAAGDRHSYDEGESATSAGQAELATGEPTAPILLADNSSAANDSVRRELDSFFQACQRGARHIGRVLFFGGLALVVSLVLLVVMRRVTANFWIPALGAGALCLVLGGVWMAAQVDHGKQLAALLPADDDVSDDVYLAQAAIESFPDEPIRQNSWDKEPSGGMAGDFDSPKDSEKKRERLDEPRQKLAEQESEEGEESEEASTRGIVTPAVPAVANEPSSGEKLSSATPAYAKPGDRPMVEDLALDESAGRASGELSQPAYGAQPEPDALGLHVKRIEQAGADASSPDRATALERKPAGPKPKSYVRRRYTENGERVEGKTADGAMDAFSGKAGAGGFGGGGLGTRGAARQELQDLDLETPADSPEPASRPAPAPRSAAPAAEEPQDPLPELPSVPEVAAELADEELDEDAVKEAPEMRVRAPEASDLLDAVEGIDNRRDLVRFRAADKNRKGLLGDDQPGPLAGHVVEVQPVFREHAKWGLMTRGQGRQPDAEETVFWDPLLIAGENGQTQVQFSLPDVEATYRVLVNGHLAGRLGSYLDQIVAKDRDTRESVKIVDPER